MSVYVNPTLDKYYIVKMLSKLIEHIKEDSSDLSDANNERIKHEKLEQCAHVLSCLPEERLRPEHIAYIAERFNEERFPITICTINNHRNNVIDPNKASSENELQEEDRR